MVDKGEPRRAIARLRLIMFGKYASYNVLIYLHAKSLGNDHRDSRTTKVWISQFKFDDGVNELPRRAFGSGF